MADFCGREKSIKKVERGIENALVSGVEETYLRKPLRMDISKGGASRTTSLIKSDVDSHTSVVADDHNHAWSHARNKFL